MAFTHKQVIRLMFCNRWYFCRNPKWMQTTLIVFWKFDSTIRFIVLCYQKCLAERQICSRIYLNIQMHVLSSVSMSIIKKWIKAIQLGHESLFEVSASTDNSAAGLIVRIKNSKLFTACTHPSSLYFIEKERDLLNNKLMKLLWPYGNIVNTNTKMFTI